MDTIDRRNLLIGTGLALTLAGCGQKGGGNSTEEAPAPGKASDALSKSSVDPQWNYGQAPWHEHPGGTVFNSGHLAVLHLELIMDGTAPKLLARRAHFDGAVTDDIQANARLIGTVITHLNGLALPSPSPMPSPSPTASPSPMPSPSPTASPLPSPGPTGVKGWKLYEGIDGFSFIEPTHLIIYIKNPGVEYGEAPIWFGSKLLHGEPAEGNGSFFKAHAYKVGDPEFQTAIGGGSQRVAYVKNYFHKNYGTDITPDCRPIVGKTDLHYALNISAKIKSYPDGIDIPITIDPDTGNMGTGTGDGEK